MEHWVYNSDCHKFLDFHNLLCNYRGMQTKKIPEMINSLFSFYEENDEKVEVYRY